MYTFIIIMLFVIFIDSDALNKSITKNENNTKTTRDIARREENDGDIEKMLDDTLNTLTELLNITDMNYTVYNYTVSNTSDSLTTILEFQNESEATRFSGTVNENMDLL